MFVKFKLEQQNSKTSETSRDITYIPVDDDATVLTLKTQVEQYVNVPAEKQEIRTFTTSFANSRKVKDLCDDRGGSIMLYAYDDDFYDNQEPKFVCFLQIYANESVIQMKEIELQQSSAMTSARETSPQPTSPLETFISLDEIESSDDEYSSEESDSYSEGSVSSDKFSAFSGQKKRKIHLNQNGEQKRQKSTPILDKISPTLCMYLDEFPKSHTNYRKSCEMDSEGSSNDDADNSKATEEYHKPSIEKDMPIATDDLNNTLRPIEESRMCSKENEREQELTDDSNQTTAVHNSPTTCKNAPSKLPPQKSPERKLSPVDPSNILPTTNDCRHPCNTIDPEKRQYVQCIICSNSNDINNDEFESLLEWFYDRFRTCDNSHQLQFMQPSPITHFNGIVWIACANSLTCDWIYSSISQYSLRPYKIRSLYADSHLCEVVIPRVLVSKEHDLFDIFKLLEKQNPNLCTLQWCVTHRRILLADEKDYDTKAVSAFCTNEHFSIWVDSKSKLFLDQVHQKLQYCFWQIVFKYVNN